MASHNQRSIDSLDPGRLSVEVPAGLTVPTMNPATYFFQEQPVVCPWCRTSEGFTLRTGVRYAAINCAQGHTWTDHGLPTSAVPQLYAVREGGGLPVNEPYAVPKTVGDVWVWLLPDPGVPSPSGTPTALPANVVKANPLPPFQLEDPSVPLPRRAAWLSSGLLAWALPQDSTLFARLALDPHRGSVARLVRLALWHLLLDTALTNPNSVSEDSYGYAPPFMSLDLVDLAARLNPDDASAGPLRDKLRSPGPGTVGFLSAADTDGLRECSAQEWDDACTLAFLTLMVHAGNTRIAMAYCAGQRSLTMMRPVLSDCFVIAPHIGP